MNSINIPKIGNISWNQSFSTNFRHSLEVALTSLNDELSKDLLLAEVTYLYKNKIYNDIEVHTQQIDKLAEEIDKIISKHFSAIEKEIDAISKLKAKELNG